MKTSDITAKAFLTAVIDVCLQRGFASASRWDVTSVLAGHPEHVGTIEHYTDYPNMPAKLVLSKAKNLIRKGLLDGCDCGCRGDFAAPPACRQCPACKRFNFHYIVGRELVTVGGMSDLFMHCECWHCHQAWTDRVELGQPTR